MYAQSVECTDKGYLNQNRELGVGGCIYKKDVKSGCGSPKHSNVIITDSGNPYQGEYSVFTYCVTEETGKLCFIS